MSLGKLHDSLTAFAYGPLLLSPTELLLTPGATFALHARDGPRPWLYEPAAVSLALSRSISLSLFAVWLSVLQFFERLEGGEGKVAVRRERSQLYIVQCLALGDFTLTLTVCERGKKKDWGILYAP